MRRALEDLEKFRAELKAENEDLRINMMPRWLANLRIIREDAAAGLKKALSVSFLIKDRKLTARIITHGVRAGDLHYRVKRYLQAGLDSLCAICSQ